MRAAVATKLLKGDLAIRSEFSDTPDSDEPVGDAHATAESARAMAPPVLFVVAILASSFLIFLVQPMVGKRILPWYGGTPSVWALCLAFYQTSLFLGYAYAHCLIRFVSPSAQIWIHGVVVGLAFLALPVLPGAPLRFEGMSNPSYEIAGVLLFNVAMPFIVLASTGPLVQSWFSNTFRDRSPYPLYAVSNIGSFAALIAYPFYLEPRFALSATGESWSTAFVFTAALVLACAFIARGSAKIDSPFVPSDRSAAESRPGIVDLAMWVLLSGAAVVLLMAVTNLLCLDVASVPFLWILPLATYLLTFILCFASESNYRPVLFMILTPVLFMLTLGYRFVFPVLTSWGLLDSSTTSILQTLLASLRVQIPALCALLFSACMILHGELYRLRPPAQRLTMFYLCVSAGGALGGLFVGLLAPILYDTYNEVRVGLGMLLLLALTARILEAHKTRLFDFRRWYWRVAMLSGFAVMIYVLVPEPPNRDVILHEDRSFFSVLRVMEYGAPGKRQRQLMSGSTLHGVEFFETDGDPIPTSYYGRATGIAAALEARPTAKPWNVGLIGLGVGTLSAYGREGDRYRYYEIDPEVAYIARDSGFFSYLETSAADVEIVVGDGRLELAKEQARTGPQEFDILVLDAFSSDAIPVHLLTAEAFQTYAKALADDGVLAAHVSNRYFELIPVVARAGLEIGMKALIADTETAPALNSQTSTWILLSASDLRLRTIAQSLRRRSRRQGLAPEHATLYQMNPANIARVPLWTDDYSDLLSVLKSN